MKYTHFGKLLTTTEYLESIKYTRKDKANYYDYSEVVYKNNKSKIKIICPIHGPFEQIALDHKKGRGCKKCGRISSAKTNIKLYGVKNPFENETIKKKIKLSNLKKYGVDNPSKSKLIQKKKETTCLLNYGVKFSSQSPIVQAKIRENNIKKYGVPHVSQTTEFKAKFLATRMNNKSYVNSYSKEACRFIETYVKMKGYDISQVAYANPENGLYEWGYRYKNQWILFDLVVFEKGFRGQLDHVIEILEYHGPFHYTKEEVDLDPEGKAYPWKTKIETKKESYERDCLKEEFGKMLTDNYTIIWNDL